MSSIALVEEYMGPLLAGNRTACRRFVLGQLEKTPDPSILYHELIWPAMERVEKLYRGDRINIASEHMATRINRSIADQLQLQLPKADPLGKRILIACADGEPEELGAQMCADLFESRGWEVYFLGGGVPNDEILSLVGQLGPGSVVPRRCPVCKSYTTISVIDGGTLLQVGAESPTVSISPNGEDSLAMRRR